MYRNCPVVWKCSGKLIQNVLCRITTILSRPQYVIQNYRLIRFCFYCHELCRNVTSVACNIIILLEFAFNSLSASPLYKLHPNLVITVPADALAPNGARTSAGTVMSTDFDISSKWFWLLNISNIFLFFKGNTFQSGGQDPLKLAVCHLGQPFSAMELNKITDSQWNYKGDTHNCIVALCLQMAYHY